MVLMLCRRSPSLMRTTRTSSAMATSILRMFSAWCSSAVRTWILPSLVTPSTSLATWSPNFLADVVPRDVGVLDGVVEDGGGERVDVQAQIREDAGHSQRVLDVGLACQPELAVVGFLGHVVGAAQDVTVVLCQVLGLRQQVSNGHCPNECTA